ncbi:MAG: hypothetical protein FVQ80_10045 [Planctomycetes bacterium]|nr:hypothetical protein [Planctomycetota bacterium]
MSIEFILGRSGTGKTRLCIDEVIAALSESGEECLVLLVPEQATYQAERAIVDDKRISGYNRLNVLSFERLVFLLLGKNAARVDISRTGQQMIVHRILREQKDNLKVLSASADSAGLSCQMADVVTELHRYAKSEEDIDELLDELKKDGAESLSYQKFLDIGLVFKEYLKFIKDKFIDPDIQLNQACKLISDSFVKGARVWVDGFAGFTESQFSILVEILKAASETKIALCVDPDDIDFAGKESIDLADWFYPTKQTYSSLIDIAKKCKLKVRDAVILKDLRRFGDSALEHIERNIFNLKPTKHKGCDNIQVISAANRRNEIQFAAQEIQRLVRDKKMRYRDIAVIASDIDSYEHYVRAYFNDYRIPFFIDKRKPLSQHPFVHFICSAIAVVSEGFSTNDIFSYLKSDLVGISRDDVDLLENYCIAYGVSGGNWVDKNHWDFQAKEKTDFDEKQINKIRAEVTRPLVELADKLASGDGDNAITAEEFTKAVFDFLEAIKFRETIAEWIGESADKETLDRHRQGYEKIVDVFDELVEVFRGQKFSYRDYSAIITSAFSQLQMGFIPPTLDQVLVGSIERSRHPDLKAVFLTGVTQKQFPVPVAESSLLNDDDRNAAAEADFELGPTTEQSLAERQYLAYIAFTRASQFLSVSYPMTNDNGSEAVRSQFVDELEELFDGLKERAIEDSDIESFEEGSPAAFGYDNKAVLEKEVVEENYGKEIRGSATRLATFAACPYKYFVRYVLRLKERAEFKLRPLDIGNFYHVVLDALVKQLNKEKKDLASIGDDELLEILNKQISKVVTGDSFLSSFKSRSLHNEFIISNAIENLESCVLGIAKMVRAGDFRPMKSEVGFGRAGEGLGEFRLKLRGGRELVLSGKIDRIDIGKIDDEELAIVFDYKRKGQSFSWKKFYHGLDMQLPIYLLAVRGSANSKVVGAFYIPIEVKIEKVTLNKLENQASKFGYKANGIFNGEFAKRLDKETSSRDSKFYNFYVSKEDGVYGNYNKRGTLRGGDFEKVLQFAEHKLVELGGDIVSGKIDVFPYKLGSETACRFCEYKAVCRFDWQINSYNTLVSVDKKEFFERAAKTNG